MPNETITGNETDKQCTRYCYSTGLVQA